MLLIAFPPGYLVVNQEDQEPDTVEGTEYTDADTVIIVVSKVRATEGLEWTIFCIFLADTHTLFDCSCTFYPRGSFATRLEGCLFKGQEDQVHRKNQHGLENQRLGGLEGRSSLGLEGRLCWRVGVELWVELLRFFLELRFFLSLGQRITRRLLQLLLLFGKCKIVNILPLIYFIS